MALLAGYSFFRSALRPVCGLSVAFDCASDLSGPFSLFAFRTMPSVEGGRDAVFLPVIVVGVPFSLTLLPSIAPFDCLCSFFSYFVSV